MKKGFKTLCSLECLLAIVILIIPTVSMIGSKLISHPILGCKQRTVVEVLSIHYRGGYVLLSDGETVEVGQPEDSIKVGTKWSGKCEIIGYNEPEWKL